MKVAFTFLMSLCLSIQWMDAQQFCGFDALHSFHEEREMECNERIQNQLLDGNQREGEVLIVPIVVHIIHNNGPENIADEGVMDAVEFLNDAFSNNGFYQNEFGVGTNIQFCLAALDPDGEYSTGIQRVVSDLTDVLVPSQESTLKGLSHWDGEQYLNVWVVKEITRELDNEGVVGFATFPSIHGSPIDGVVLEASAMGTSAISTSVLVHEVGHYLGLYHTFQGGCPNDDCLSSGDRICDTPPDAAAFNLLCYDGTNSCTTDEDDTGVNNPYRAISLGGLGDQLDMQTNFMDYASLACFERFTEGQVERMRASLIEVRGSLLETDRCSGPCDNPIDVVVTCTSLEVQVGESVSFVNSSSNFIEAEWFLDGASQGQSTAFSFTPTEQGFYSVSLSLMSSQPGCFETVSFEINVTCPVTSSFTNGPTSVEAGGILELENTSSGASTYAWYVDGVVVSNEESPTLSFEETGAFTVQLLAEGESCSEWSTPLNISVGTCTSGNEHNLWLFFNQFGSGYGLDFNTVPPTAVLENNLPPNADHCKTTLCDAAGNLLFLSTGTEVLNRNYDVMPNGDDLLGSTSSHYGTMLVAKPESNTDFFVFHSSLPDGKNDGGLFYSIIDKSLEDGFGDVTTKNEFLGNFGQEAITCVRHCNLIDFWLLTYDQIEGRYIAWLVSGEGINPEPIISEIQQEVFHALPLTPNTKGNQIMHGNFLMDFDASSGSLTVAVDFDLTNLVGWEFSGSGQYLYLLNGALTTALSQVDLWNLDPENAMANAIDLPAPSGMIYIYPQRAPDGNIYMENAFGGDIARIIAPNLPADQLVFEPVFENFQALINSFGNHFHRYVDGESLFIEGDAVVCAGSSIPYAVYGHECLQGEVEWIVEGASFSEISNGQISIDFTASGTVFITALLNSSCGAIGGTLSIETMPDPGLELGEDFGTCVEGTTHILDAGDGFASYAWSSGGEGQTIQVSEPGVYAVTVDAGGCFATDEVEFLAQGVEPINLGPDVLLCDGALVILDAGSGYNDYTWQDGTTGPVYTIFEGGTYSVTASLPCFSSDTMVVDGCGEGIGLGLEEQPNIFIRMLPNPNRGDFVLEWEESLGLQRWELVSASGQQIREGGLYANGNARFRFDVAKGIYILRLAGSEGVYFERFVIE